MKSTCLPLTPFHHRDQVFHCNLSGTLKVSFKPTVWLLFTVFRIPKTKTNKKQSKTHTHLFVVSCNCRVTHRDPSLSVCLFVCLCLSIMHEWFGIPGAFKKTTQVSLITRVTPLSYTIPHIYNRHKAVQLICQQNETDRVKIMSCVLNTFRKTEIRHNHFVKWQAIHDYR